MESKIVKIISIIGNTAIVNIDGEKLKAKIEGNIPSNIFLGEIINEKGKIIIRVKDNLSTAKNIDSILFQLDIPKSNRNILITKVLMSLSLPITLENLSILKDYSIPYLLAGIIVKSKNQNKKILFLTEKIFEEFKNKKIDEKNFSIFVNNFIPQDNEEFKIFWEENKKERWFSVIEYENNSVKKIILSTTIENTEVLIIFEKQIRRYNLEIAIFSDRHIRLTGDDELKKNLESLGFTPILVNIETFGGLR